MSQPWSRHPPEVLPAVVCEGPVRLGHLVSVFTALHRCTETVGCVQDLVGEPLGHRLLAGIFCIAGEPAQRKGVGAVWFDVNRHLVGGGTDPPWAYFQCWADLVKGL